MTTMTALGDRFNEQAAQNENALLVTTLERILPGIQDVADKVAREIGQRTILPTPCGEFQAVAHAWQTPLFPRAHGTVSQDYSVMNAEGKSPSYLMTVTLRGRDGGVTLEYASPRRRFMTAIVADPSTLEDSMLFRDFYRELYSLVKADAQATALGEKNRPGFAVGCPISRR